MGIKLGDISPLAGAVTGKGLFGKGLAKLADSGAGFLIPASYLAKSQRDKAARAAAQQSPEGITHVRKGPFGLPSRNAPITPRIARMISQAQANMPATGGPMMDEVMVAEEAPAGAMMRKGGKVKKKPMAAKKMAKGGSVSSASKRGDGCATKGKTKGRFV